MLEEGNRFFNQKLKSMKRVFIITVFLMLLISFDEKVEAKIQEPIFTEELVLTMEPENFFLEKQPAMEYTEEDVTLLATVIFSEAGVCDEIEKYRVGNVVLNRVNDTTDQFKNTIKDVIYQKNQFTSVGGQNWKHGPTEEEIEIARNLLEGTRVFPDNIVWFSRKHKYGKLYYTSEWHQFSGLEQDEESEDTSL